MLRILIKIILTWNRYLILYCFLTLFRCSYLSRFEKNKFIFVNLDPEDPNHFPSFRSESFSSDHPGRI